MAAKNVRPLYPTAAEEAKLDLGEYNQAPIEVLPDVGPPKPKPSSPSGGSGGAGMIFAMVGLVAVVGVGAALYLRNKKGR